MSSSYTKDGDLSPDLCDDLGIMPQICGSAQSNGESQNVSVRVCINLDAQSVDITLIGPDDVWFGVGFDGVNMNNIYSVVVHGDNLSEYEERILTQYTPGSTAPFDGVNGVILVDSNTANGIKTVHVIRDRTSDQNGVYSFPAIPSTINVIFGEGTGTTFEGPMGGHSQGAVLLDLAYVLPSDTTTS